MARKTSSIVTPQPVKLSNKPRDLLKFDLDNENVTIQALGQNAPDMSG